MTTRREIKQALGYEPERRGEAGWAVLCLMLVILGVAWILASEVDALKDRVKALESAHSQAQPPAASSPQEAR